MTSSFLSLMISPTFQYEEWQSSPYLLFYWSRKTANDLVFAPLTRDFFIHTGKTA